MNEIDVLSDVFSTLRIHSDLYFSAQLRGEFSVEVPSEMRRIRFHLLCEGRCWLQLPDGGINELTQGDIAIVPNGVAQVLSSAPGLAPVPLSEVVENGALQQGVLRYGEGERRTRLLCGFCQFDEAIDHPVLANLPELMVLRPQDLGSAPWTAMALRLLSMEADLNAQGTVGVLTRLLEIIFIQSVRRMETDPLSPAKGFMAALSDVQLSRALQVMHTQPHVSWKIQGLAEIAGMSRAGFARRFTELLGVPPIEYLTHWRLIKARALLAGTNLDMLEIAGRCGYASTPSFSRRFKETFGVGPGSYRRASKML